MPELEVSHSTTSYNMLDEKQQRQAIESLILEQQQQHQHQQQPQHFGPVGQPSAEKNIAKPTTTTTSLITIYPTANGGHTGNVSITSTPLKQLNTFKGENNNNIITSHHHHSKVRSSKCANNNINNNNASNNNINNNHIQNPLAEKHLALGLAAKNSLESLGSRNSLINNVSNNTTSDVDSSTSSTPQPHHQLTRNDSNKFRARRQSSLASLTASNNSLSKQNEQQIFAVTKFSTPPNFHPPSNENQKQAVSLDFDKCKKGEQNEDLTLNGQKQVGPIEPSSQFQSTKSARRIQHRVAIDDQEEDSGEAGPDRSSNLRQFNSRLSVVVPPKGVGKKKSPFPGAGIIASLLSSIFFSVSVTCVKLLPDSDSVTEKAKAVFFRGVFMMIFCAATLIYQRTSFIVPRQELWINVLRCLLGSIGVFGMYCSFIFISIGDATAIVFSSPLWTSILGYFIFKEPLRWTQLVALPASLFGIIMIAHPSLIVNVDHHGTNVATNDSSIALSMDLRQTTTSDIVNNLNNTTNFTALQSAAKDNMTSIMNAQEQIPKEDKFDFEHRWPGIAIALFLSVIVSVNYIVLKYREHTPVQTTTFWFGFTMTIVTVATMCFTGFGSIPNTVSEWALLTGLGVTSWLAQTCLQWAFLHEEVGVLSVVRTMDVATTFILSAIFLHESILWTSIVGATIISLVVVFVMLSGFAYKKKSSNNAPESSHGTTPTRNEPIIDSMPNAGGKAPYIIAKA